MVRKPIFGSRRVITAFRPIVLAWLKTALPSTPSRRAPSTTGPAGSSRSLGTFVTLMRPSRNATTSVNVPPTSTPSIALRAAIGVKEPKRGAGSR